MVAMVRTHVVAVIGLAVLVMVSLQSAPHVAKMSNSMSPDEDGPSQVVRAAAANLPPQLVNFSLRIYGPPMGPYIAFVNESVPFWATLSDPELDNLTVSWDFGDGTPVKTYDVSDYIGGNVSCSEQHTYLSPGFVTMYFNYTDNQPGGFHQGSTMQQLDVRIDDVPPTADAGENLIVLKDTIARFNGSASDDDWGSIANYTWTFEYEGVTKVLWGPTPEFTFEVPGVYQVLLNVTDHVGNHNWSWVSVLVLDSAIPEFGPLFPVVAMGILIVTCALLRRRTSRAG